MGWDQGLELPRTFQDRQATSLLGGAGLGVTSPPHRGHRVASSRLQGHASLALSQCVLFIQQREGGRENNARGSSAGGGSHASPEVRVAPPGLPRRAPSPSKQAKPQCPGNHTTTYGTDVHAEMRVRPVQGMGKGGRHKAEGSLGREGRWAGAHLQP